MLRPFLKNQNKILPSYDCDFVHTIWARLLLPTVYKDIYQMIKKSFQPNCTGVFMAN
jgi:hypothetical protein